MEKTPTVLDLNVLLAATLKPQGPTAAKLLTLYITGTALYTPDYVREEFQKVARELAEKKRVDKQQLVQAFQNLLNITRQARIEEYGHKLEAAKKLVSDPSDAPYAALALCLAEKHGRAVILTYNRRDYKLEELEKHNIKVLTPREI